MTESEILELAMQCDFDTRDGFDGPLITFANAIAQRTREDVAQKLLQLGALGDGDYIEAIRSMK